MQLSKTIPSLITVAFYFFVKNAHWTIRVFAQEVMEKVTEVFCYQLFLSTFLGSKLHISNCSTGTDICKSDLLLKVDEFSFQKSMNYHFEGQWILISVNRSMNSHFKGKLILISKVNEFSCQRWMNFHIECQWILISKVNQLS